ncbi:FAD-dependent oxidoreductase [Isoptericola jiangsuensis]|uniref:FAD-dependent oxidoreductase n=1 Tax=Isoptericola jiangsuensis TaxID=548579 RepID=UPI003AB0E914
MKIVIVGGVGGGMSAAARARRLSEDAEIVVLDRGEHVSFAGCGLPYHVGGEVPEGDLLVQTPASLRASLALDVRTRHDVVALDTAHRSLTVRTPDGEEQIGYDALLLSPGARAVRPPVPGLDSPRVRTLRTIADARELRAAVQGGARHAVVLGAGFIGLEAAEALASQGVDVTLVETAGHPLPPLEPELGTLVADELRHLGVTVRTGVAATAVTHGTDHDVVDLGDGTRVDADVVVLAVGVRPDTDVFADAGIVVEGGAIVVDERGRTSADGIWAVGDATVSTDAVTGSRRPVALAGPAARAGRIVADQILRPATARPLPTALGTAVVRVGELTAATTGAHRTALTRAGIDHRTVHLHAAHHVGWFPGAEQIHLVVHVGTGDGRVLGAQAVGRSGVDKRIDVLATAIRAGLTADDLVDLDLAYAPPFGAAKDPVNLAGMVAANTLDGTLRLWYAEDVDQVLGTALVLDVRSADEVAQRHLPDSLHVPHTELRERLDEVVAAAAGRPVRVLCGSGVRSHLAHRILDQAGLDSASLSGGMLTLQAVLATRGSDLGGLLVAAEPALVH